MKFNYQDGVEIITGFYKGQVGVIARTSKWPFFEQKYYVYIGTKYLWYKESDLKLRRKAGEY